MNLSNWFRVLELKATATKSEVKSAYYRLCQIYHPDKSNNCPKAVQRFRTINEAYEGLMKAPIETINVQFKYAEPKPRYAESKPRYTEPKHTESKAKYKEPKTRYRFYGFKYTPPTSKAKNTKSENNNEQSSNTNSKARSKQDEKLKQELKFERYFTNRLKRHVIFDPQVEEQIRECYRIRFKLINKLNKNLEQYETDEETEY